MFFLTPKDQYKAPVKLDSVKDAGKIATVTGISPRAIVASIVKKVSKKKKLTGKILKS
jgi:hypothetical protein